MPPKKATQSNTLARYIPNLAAAGTADSARGGIPSEQVPAKRKAATKDAEAKSKKAKKDTEGKGVKESFVLTFEADKANERELAELALAPHNRTCLQAPPAQFLPKKGCATCADLGRLCIDHMKAIGDGEPLDPRNAANLEAIKAQADEEKQPWPVVEHRTEDEETWEEEFGEVF